MKIMELNQDNFNEKVINTKGKVLVYFSAPWCGHCQHMDPTLEWVQDTLGHNITIGKLNVDNDDRLALKYAVKSVPTFLLFENGVPVKRSVGSMTREQLTTWLY